MLRLGCVVLVAMLALASCPRPEPESRTTVAAPTARDGGAILARDAEVASAPPGLRLPAGVVPLAYDVRLEVDPDREAFAGTVTIRVRLDAPVDHVWLHAVDLEIASARWQVGARSGALRRIAAPDAEEMVGLAFGTQLPRGEVTLAFAYTGHAGRDAEGLFRQKHGTRWFLFAQSQSIFARRILPCFDEPGYKPRWRVTLVVPAQQVALANAPVEDERVLPDRRRELRFAEIGPMPSYLFAIAVGPFTLVDAGKLGRRGVPLRVAVAPGDAGRTKAIAAWTPKLVDALERYLDRPLALAKLDLVAVPQFFGAMENPGLITFEDSTLLGDPDDAVYVRKLVTYLAHELAHHWFGNSVTPAWWNDLWLSEAFATWLDDKLPAEVLTSTPTLDDAVLHTQLARAEALAADREPDAQPLRRTVDETDDIEDAFDTISYEKGAAVLAMFEAFVGPDRFRDAIRAYLTGHRDGTATAIDFTAALERVSSPQVVASFTGYLDQPGTPVVGMSVAADCHRDPAQRAIVEITASKIPVCVRYPSTAGPARACVLADGHTKLALPNAAPCPAWIAGNADGRGYYELQTRDPRPFAVLAPGERIAAGHDVAAGLMRGDAGIDEALGTIGELTASSDPYAQLAALAIVQAIDHLVSGNERTAWSAWVALRFRPLLTKRAVFEAQKPVERALRSQLVPLIPNPRFDRETVAAAKTVVERVLRGERVRSEDADAAFLIAAPGGGRELFLRVLDAAGGEASPRRHHRLIELLGTFGPNHAGLVVDLVGHEEIRTPPAFAAIESMLERPSAREITWSLIMHRLDRLLAHFAPADASDLIDATASLCDPLHRAQVAAAFARRIDKIVDGERALQHALRSIDRCIARRGKLGDLPAALRRAGVATSGRR